MEERYRSLPLNPLRAFAIASRHRSFTAAARHMGVSQVAISRQISILEAYLGVKLFERSSHSVKLTDIGRSFGHEIAGLFDGIERATRQIVADENDATINVRVYPSFLNHWLMPRLQAFTALYPQYRVRFDTTVEPLDFRSTYLDLAIQLGQGSWREAKAQWLFDERVDAVCSLACAERLASQVALRQIADTDILQSKYRREEWGIWAAGAGVTLGACTSTEFDSSLLTYSAARQGFGLAIGQLALLRPELEAGALVRPFACEVATGAAFYAVWPTTKSLGLKTRRFIDWLAAAAAEETGEAPPEGGNVTPLRIRGTRRPQGQPGRSRYAT